MLPAPDMTSGVSLSKALELRKTTRNFSDKGLSDQILSDLLWAAFGINRKDSGKRTAPSARNWQEIDIYVAMAKGLYIYLPAEHGLKMVKSIDLRPQVGMQPFTATAPVGIIFVADYSRMKGAKDDRFLFYSAVDTGFISQNIYLFCASRNLATVVLGSVEREILGKAMGLGKDQHIVLTQPVGHMGK
ncbi:MAG: nitroreductase [Candidatus Wallbacteria bacterium HGW-Wallbacteria-1]|uniref:Nitroreductase n=1 Tax=Candidatus Wallbacteria bacterium HGW-Wallbacteria-1 TaxID=2013854 RepID=A0A2N1PJE0_9BACT|nr:MAG: nitroreductase [Candidatus Wallbacteria bacterium HGW-Wallbacteria-1]